VAQAPYFERPIEPDPADVVLPVDCSCHTNHLSLDGAIIRLGFSACQSLANDVEAPLEAISVKYFTAMTFAVGYSAANSGRS
jgi:hypothetical protein